MPWSWRRGWGSKILKMGGEPMGGGGGGFDPSENYASTL